MISKRLSSYIILHLKQTNTQTNKQTNRQTNKQTDKQTNKKYKLITCNCISLSFRCASECLSVASWMF